jgi:hypothetical protein
MEASLSKSGMSGLLQRRSGEAPDAGFSAAGPEAGPGSHAR